MARPTRPAAGGYCYHVLNRGNGRMKVFHKAEDYRAFEKLIGQACERLAMRVLSYCFMPNHFHFVLWPYSDGDLSVWMQWLTTTHVRRYHQHYNTTGHLWEGRFKAFPIQDDQHLLTVKRYVERNPLRANLVQRAEDWPWSSLRHWSRQQGPAFLEVGPVPHPPQWTQRVNEPQSPEELKALQQALRRGSPFGAEAWRGPTAARLGIESSLRSRGRPTTKNLA